MESLALTIELAHFVLRLSKLSSRMLEVIEGLEMSASSRLNVLSGVHNLLVNCAEAKSGDRLLIAFEPEDFGYFDRDIRSDIAAGARAMGLDVSMVDVGFNAVQSDLPQDLKARFSLFDVVLFLSRLGDQLRFSEMPPGPKFVVCFALNSQLLGSSFGFADYRAFCRAKDAVDDCILKSRTISLTCRAGTHVTGSVPKGTIEAKDTTSTRFPMSVFSPVPADAFSGRVALGGFLTGTGSAYYDRYTIEFEGPVFAILEAGRLTGFEGGRVDVAVASEHYDRVSSSLGIERNFVHSWHAGIHPGCGFPWDIRENFERWGGSAFGNPRVLHFHTCGAYAPGEISWNVFDPTIEIDGLRVWEDGTFHLDRLEGGPEILAEYPCAAETFANPDRNVGLMDIV